MSDHRILAVIPARSGSKRFPGKNMAPWGKDDLLSWAIKRCEKSKQFDSILVLGDKEITTATWLTRTAMYMERPARLVRDDSDIKDSLRWADKAGMFDGYTDIALVQTTSPLYEAEFINDDVKTYRSCNIRNLVSVNQYTLHEDGGIYLISLGLLRLEKYNLMSSRLYISVRTKSAITGRSLDINTPEDFYIACAIRDKRVM